MAENDKKPRLRFKGFTNSWEQRKLGDVFEYERPDAYIVKSDKYSDNYKTPVLTANKGFILGYTNETNTYDRECIIFDDFTLDNKYVTFPFMVKSSAIKILTTKSDNFLPFASQLLQTAKIENLGHARHYISVVQPTLVNVPKTEEQTKIGALFQQLDNLITLHQRKYEKLKNIKKASLDKMFPQKNSQIPLIRFKNFTNSWEQRKLGDVSQYVTSSLKLIDAEEDGKYDLYDANSIVGKTNKNVQPRKYITIIKDGSGVGTVRLLPENTSFIGTMGAIFANNSEIGFLYPVLQKFDFTKHINGATIPHVYYNEYKNDLIFIPSDSEQTKIGALFQQLDNLITLHQRKYEKLKNIKKAMMEQMFA